MVRAAFSNWPELFQDFQPLDAEHLRKWLTAKAGYVDRVVVEPPPEIIADNEAVKKLAMLWMEQAIDAVRRKQEHTWLRRHGDNFVVFIPKSIAFEAMGHNEFGALNDDVSKILDEIIGLDGEELLQRQKEVA